MQVLTDREGKQHKRVCKRGGPGGFVKNRMRVGFMAASLLTSLGQLLSAP